MSTTSNRCWSLSNEISVKRRRGRPKKALRKFSEIRPNIPNPNPRKFLRSVSFGIRLEKSDLIQLDKRAKAIGLNRSEYIRKILFSSIRFMLSAEEYTEFRKRAERMELSDYDYAKRILINYLMDSEPQK